MICIAIDNSSSNTVGGSYYSAHQVVGKFVECHIYMVRCIHSKCQTRAGISGDVNKTLKCVSPNDREGIMTQPTTFIK